MYVFLMIKIADRKVLWRNFRSTSGFIGYWKKFSQKFLLHQKIRRKISGGVLGRVFFTYDPILWVLSSILTLMSVNWQIKAQLLKTSIGEIYLPSCWPFVNVRFTQDHFINIRSSTTNTIVIRTIVMNTTWSCAGIHGTKSWSARTKRSVPMDQAIRGPAKFWKKWTGAAVRRSLVLCSQLDIQEQGAYKLLQSRSL